MTESAERLLLWADSHGGSSEVSKKAGIDRQIFHSLKTKDIEPSLPTLKKIYMVYPTLDIHWISTGEKREGVVYPSIDRSFIEAENERLKFELQELRSELSETKQEKRKLFDLLGKHESETESLFVDTEQGIDLMNWILYSQSGFALSERLN